MTTETPNIIEIQGSCHLIVKGLKFRGGSDSIRFMDWDFVTIEDCENYEIDQVAAILVLGVRHPARRQVEMIVISPRAVADTRQPSAAR